ncbi:hypothetical protein THMIRHAM_13010 [Thiomicrorhabdus immobilis]|uniref:Solute-binding protein family 3/N-terminal domain-containing protein n=1 Tax=Thiomicrorhabdus immobilis TaxID=2791037 RepID=A0ABN6CWV8_9GAMM|nr:ABC transporter substrate-binding protein [Thiomicrorhabdus immobilis]BCN93516.1 hypothetical protein THMIRHAM_13010 [Thiomicrorhabdus immobilis]
MSQIATLQRMFKLHLITFIFSLILFVPQQSMADTLRIATDEWCPYDCIAAQNDGKVGYMGDLLVAAMQNRGHQVEFVEVSYSRGLELVREGKLDATMACFREEAPDFVFSNAVQGISNSTFFSRKDNVWRYQGLDSLKKAKMIGVIKGYDYVDPVVMDYINQHPSNVLEITGEKPLERLLQMLLSGRLTAVIDDKMVLEYKIQQMGHADQVVVSGSTSAVINVYSGFSPALPKSKHYAQILEEEIEKMRQSGQLQKILSAYGIQDWQP